MKSVPRAGLCALLLIAPTVLGDVYEDRVNYKRAVYALETKSTGEFKRLRKTVGKYTLAPYLDYYEARRRLSSIGPNEALDLRERWRDLPIGGRFFGSWMRQQAESGRWDRYLKHYEPSDDVAARCYYLRALYRSGERAAALDDVAPLWTVGHSQPSACDSLFDAWLAAGRVDDETAWRRLHLALQENSVSLARYLLKLFSAEKAAGARAYYDAHVRPSVVRNGSTFANDVWGREALGHGLIRYASDEPVKAQNLWEKYRDRYDFTDQQRDHIEQHLVLALARDGELPQRVYPHYSPPIIEGIADAAIARGADAIARDWIRALPDHDRIKVKWRYWLARSAANLGEDSSRATMADLATERTYYGFLAANDLGIEPMLNEQKVAGVEAAAMRLREVDGVTRMTELYAVNDFANARREWIWLASSLSDDQQLALVEHMAQIGWTDQAIIAANRADLTDLLSIRFPMPFVDTFRRHAFETRTPISYLMAVARQESAFNPMAVSSAGARGLMQLMIGTARQTAATIRDPKPSNSTLLDPLVNVRLGAHHIAELMAKYGNHRAIVAAAYNAGSHRADRWLQGASGTPTQVWIERIPYRETRNYVKNVLAFSYVYGVRLGAPGPVLGAHERYIP